MPGFSALKDGVRVAGFPGLKPYDFMKVRFSALKDGVKVLVFQG